MKNLLRLEQMVIFGLSIWFFSLFTEQAWWVYLAVFLAPDIAFLGYLISPAVGAICYNLLHHQGLWVVIGITGYVAGIDLVTAVAIIFVGHSAFDRVFGYGLKYPDDFKNTHLGVIGGEAE